MELSKEFIDKWKFKDMEMYFPIDEEYEVKCNFTHGVPDGKYELYYKGKLECCGEFKMGVRIGKWLVYSDGILCDEYNFSIIDNDYIEDNISYYGNGKINNRCKYLNDEINGFVDTCYYSGELYSRIDNNYGEYYEYDDKGVHCICLQKIEI
jgi:antitoxin component YwqK of YwqJK toxin-antitoxin module